MHFVQNPLLVWNISIWAFTHGEGIFFTINLLFSFCIVSRLHFFDIHSYYTFYKKGQRLLGKFPLVNLDIWCQFVFLSNLLFSHNIQDLLKSLKYLKNCQFIVHIFGTTVLLVFIVPANIYLRKVNYRNTRKRCEICSELIMKAPERRDVNEQVNVS